MALKRPGAAGGAPAAPQNTQAAAPPPKPASAPPAAVRRPAAAPVEETVGPDTVPAQPAAQEQAPVQDGPPADAYTESDEIFEEPGSMEDRPEQHPARNPDPLPQGMDPSHNPTGPRPPATQSEAQLPATPRAGNVAVNMAELEEEGYAGLELNFSSFTTLKIEDGRIMDGQGNDWGTAVPGKILGTRQQYLYKNVAKTSPVTEKEEDFFYSADGHITTTGLVVQELLQEWEAKGWSFERKAYVFAFTEVVFDDGGTDLVQVQIPPTSIGRLTGYIATNRAGGRGLPRDYITSLEIGSKVTSVPKPFYPWAFRYVEPAEATE